MPMKHFLLFCIALSFCQATPAQSIEYQQANNIPLNTSTGNISNAWAGGLNSSTFSTFDFDQDGVKDLLVFDRQQNRPIVFLAKQNAYVFDLNYMSVLPPLSQYAMFYDYDKDNKLDLFTSTSLGIKVYRNVSTPSQIKFQLFKDPIYTRYYSQTLSNMSMTSQDLPFLGDIDKDGDMDILHFNSQTGENAVFETNFSMEKYGKPDSLHFGTTNVKWGGFQENTCTNYLFGVNGEVSYNYRLEHVGAGALTVLDVDNNGLPDVLIGKYDCQNLNLLKNNGSSSSTFYTQLTSSYPIASPANALYYPLTFLEDIDFDGVKDLIVTMGLNTPNSNTDVTNTAWYYKNSGANSLPSYTLQSKSFIQNTMLDLGANTVPAFADMDGDGDIDLFVSNSTNLKSKGASITYFQNTGTSTSPSFLIVDSNYLSLSSQLYEQLFITFADLNNDNQLDLICSSKKSNVYDVKVYYNQSVSGLSFSAPQTLAIPLDQPSSLCFVDIDNDSMKDLLLGDADGFLSHYKNTGTVNAPSFTFQTDNFGGLSSTNQNLNVSIADIDFDSKPDLLTVNNSGQIKICSDFLHKANSNFPFVLLKTNENNILLGQNCSLAHADLDGDGKFEIMSGSGSGGVILLKFKGIVSKLEVVPTSESKHILHIWPNPTEENVSIQIPESGTLQISNALGIAVYVSNETKINTLDISNLHPGLYYISFSGNSGKKYTQKLVVR